MMNKGIVCKRCGKEILKEDKCVLSSKTYCPECFIIIKQNAEDYKNLISYICKIFKIDAPTGAIMKQIKSYRDKYNYSYAGIQYTLWYCYEILELTIEQQFGISFVKTYYNKAENYYEKGVKTREIVEKWSNEKFKTKIVKRNNNIRFRKPILIDLNDIAKDGDSH